MTIPIQEIGFDFDGVIADTAEAFIRLACTKYDYCSFTQADITNFELEHCLDIPTKLVEDIFTEILHDSIATGVMPIPGAVESIELFTKSSTVTIITARAVKAPVLDWLDLFFSKPAKRKIKVVITGDHDDKIRHIQHHRLNYFIDDRAETCHQLSKDNITPFVYTQPWNKHRHNLQTVENWAEIRDLVGTDTLVSSHEMP